MDPRQQQSPGFVEALIRRLRGATGMEGRQDPSAAGAAQTVRQMPSYREYQIRAAESGQPVMSIEEWRRNPQ